MRYLIVLLLLTGGCSMQETLERRSEAVADAVNYYCHTTTSEDLRAAFDKEVNARVSPNKFTIECVGTAPVPTK